MNLEDLDLMNLDEYDLMNLATQKGTSINEFEAKKGSQTMFDFKNGDPLANTHVKDMHMRAGAKIDFAGASGKQEMGVMDQMQKGTQARTMTAAKNAKHNLNAADTALNDQSAVMDAKFKAVDHAFKDAGIKMVLLI